MDILDQYNLNPADLKIDIYRDGQFHSAVRITHIPTNTKVVIDGSHMPVHRKKIKALELLRKKLKERGEGA